MAYVAGRLNNQAPFFGGPLSGTHMGTQQHATAFSMQEQSQEQQQQQQQQQVQQATQQQSMFEFSAAGQKTPPKWIGTRRAPRSVRLRVQPKLQVSVNLQHKAVMFICHQLRSATLLANAADQRRQEALDKARAESRAARARAVTLIHSS